MKAYFKNIKVLLAAAALVAAGVVCYLALLESHKPAKFYAVEPMTATRPARFEELKFKLDPAVDLRAPASTGK